MAATGIPALLVALVAALLLAATNAQLQPGPVFPYFDNCRRQQTNQLRNVTYLGRTMQPLYTEFCWRVNVLKSACQVETFSQKRVAIKSRCCDTTFAKIKFYANVECRRQFLPSPIEVPLDKQFSKIVSPNWEYTKADQQAYTSVKYTQFGPIPQNVVDGTKFCLRVSPPTGKEGSTCDVSGLAGISSKANKAKGIYQLAIYDRKVNNYECCPTFTYKIA